MKATEIWFQLSSAITGIFFVCSMFEKLIPYQIRSYFNLHYINHLISLFSPYIYITFQEHAADSFKRSEAYSAIQNYLSANSSKLAKRLKADFVTERKSVILTMDDYQEIPDYFQGIQIWWSSSTTVPTSQSKSSEGKRYFVLKLHRCYREIITGSYIDHVMEQGKSISLANRQRKLYTNNLITYSSKPWSHVVFEHPASFDTLAIPFKMKKEIKNDLIKFSNSKDYYAKVGKAWKRGYLLHGPPGTGKSTMIAAMANLLNYDVYDLELTSVRDNTELKKLLIGTTGKSIIVIEDIDCSLDLTGQRKKNKKNNNEEKEKDPDEEEEEKERDPFASKVTLSGLLNFIDGIWSSCGGERVIVFTTNYVEKLDPSLIRRGRMDKHIHLSYCSFEAFQILANNYLGIESHELFPEIEKLLGETKMTPADVAENLMPKWDEDDEVSCLKNLIEALEEAKKKAKEEKEGKLKAEKEKEEQSNCKEDDVKEEIKENGEI